MTERFTIVLLEEYSCRLSECANCGSLQSEVPSWLEDAYSRPHLDFSKAQRPVECRAALWLLLTLTGRRRNRLLDYGGGNGLLCRLLRDAGLDAYTCDTYEAADFAIPFQVDIAACKPGQFQIVTAFEVLEHMVTPADEIDLLFSLQPDILIASTDVYRPEFGPDWYYLSPHGGQHVFFYSRRALEWIGVTRGYHYLSSGCYHIFARAPVTFLQRAAFGLAFRHKVVRIAGALAAAANAARHINRDQHEFLERRGGRPG